MNASTLKLWQLISPALPVGAYSYSQALEHVHFEASCTTQPRPRLAARRARASASRRLDLPILRARASRLGRRATRLAVRRLSRTLEARRETAELRFEDLAMGSALAAAAHELGTRRPGARACRSRARSPSPPSNWSIAAEDACAGYAWAWCEAQVAAAVKLVPLGHTAGQRMLLALGLEIPAAIATAAACRDDEIGASLPGLAIASALHETQYTRLFRS